MSGMKRLKDNYLNVIRSHVSLENKRILEIGAGNGSRSVQIAKYAGSLVAIDPDADKILEAEKFNPHRNITYLVGNAEKLEFAPSTFNIVIFTLSLHHVPPECTRAALDEALRVLKPGGNLVFLEPESIGSFFETEILFDACDGDERKEKALAYSAILGLREKIEEVTERYDETVFEFESKDDFIKTMRPKKNLDQLEKFLESHRYELNAWRRISIFKK